MRDLELLLKKLHNILQCKIIKVCNIRTDCQKIRKITVQKKPELFVGNESPPSHKKKLYKTLKEKLVIESKAKLSEITSKLKQSFEQRVN